MYLEALLIGLLIGILRNGRFMYFNATRFKGWSIAFFAFVLYIIPYFLHLFKIPFTHMQWLSYGSIAVIGVVVLLNINRRGMKLIFIGLLLNLIVMGFYNGKMPIDIEKMRGLGYESFAVSVSEGNVINYIESSQADGFVGYFGKVIALPKIYPLAKVLSIGDLFVTLGIILLIQNEMLLKSTRMKGSMIQFSYKNKY